MTFSRRCAPELALANGLANLDVQEFPYAKGKNPFCSDVPKAQMMGAVRAAVYLIMHKPMFLQRWGWR